MVELVEFEAKLEEEKLNRLIEKKVGGMKSWQQEMKGMDGRMDGCHLAGFIFDFVKNAL